jgi:hypothetical protein
VLHHEIRHFATQCVYARARVRVCVCVRACEHARVHFPWCVEQIPGNFLNIMFLTKVGCALCAVRYEVLFNYNLNERRSAGNHGTRWSSWPAADPRGSVLTSSRQSSVQVRKTYRQSLHVQLIALFLKMCRCVGDRFSCLYRWMRNTLGWNKRAKTAEIRNYKILSVIFILFLFVYLLSTLHFHNLTLPSPYVIQKHVTALNGNPQNHEFCAPPPLPQNVSLQRDYF